MLGGKFIRKSLKTSTFEKALKTILLWEGGGPTDPETPRGPITVQDAVRGYLEDAKARNLGEVLAPGCNGSRSSPAPFSRYSPACFSHFCLMA